MDTIFWLIMAGVFAAIVVAAVVIVRSNRQAALRGGEPAPELAPVAEHTPVSPLEPAEAEPAAVQVAVEDGVEAPVLDVPEAPGSRMARLRRRLSASSNPFARGLLGLLTADRLDAEAWEDLEATLITADLGVGPTTELIGGLRKELSIDGVADPAKARQVLRDQLVGLVDPSLDRELRVTGEDGRPGVVLVVGVNGTGKTTTIGKLAAKLSGAGLKVMVAAGDTFRAAAIEQLKIWADRTKSEFIGTKLG
ncbi:MAG: signal recognition particle receptor subunit alpha, partial [Propionicimonas sp.]